MNDSEIRRLQMFQRVRDFGIEHGGDFPNTSLAQQLFTSLTEVITELGGQATSEVSGRGSARQSTETRSQARAALRDALEAISRTARAMAGDVPGLDDKFRVPRNNGDQLLLNAARAFVNDAEPLRPQFVAHELPTTFLVDLQADIDELEAAISRQASSVGDHVAARAGIDDAIDRGTQVVRKLHAIVRNKYANNPMILAEWTSASHTERAPRRIPPPPPPAPPSQPTA